MTKYGYSVKIKTEIQAGEIMNNMFLRTQMLLGEESVEKLQNSRVAVFGLGGVGGYSLEALVRTGIGSIDLIDGDTVDITNLNRQITATQSTVGQIKTTAARERAEGINPDIKITEHNLFFCAENADKIDFSVYDYVIDAIDTVSSKIELILRCKAAGTPIISSMGTGNKLKPSMLEVSDIYKTSVCPLARVMRYELRKRGIKNLKVVYSKEEPFKSNLRDGKTGKAVPASCMPVPAVAGIILAGEVIGDILKKC